MKIEKGKLYYDTRTNQIFKAHDYYGGIAREGITDKVAVYCATKEDWDYVNKVMGWDWDYSESFSIRLLNNAHHRLQYIEHAVIEGYRIITIDRFKGFYPPNEEQDSSVRDVIVQNNESKIKETFNPQPYYDNSKGSLYKVATERGWSSYIFDVVKRLERGGKKDPLKQEIEKSIDVLKIWLNEIDE